MAIFKVTVKQYYSDKYHGDILVDTQLAFVEKRLFRQARFLSPFGIGYRPGDVFDRPLMNHLKHFGDGFHEITVKKMKAFAHSNLNWVALADAPELLKILEEQTVYSLTETQRQKSLLMIHQVRNNPHLSLLDIFEAFLLAPELEHFALTIQQELLGGISDG